MNKTRTTHLLKVNRTHRTKTRKIHVNLSEDVHRRLRVKCALDDITIQEFVAGLLTKAVKEISVSRPQKEKAL